MTGGQGAYFETGAGDRWLDLGSLSYQANLGHGHQAVIEAIKAQADSLCMALPSAVFPAKVELAERLLALAPEGFSKVFFTLGGSEANEKRAQDRAHGHRSAQADESLSLVSRRQHGRGDVIR